ncbi:MAG: FMN-binding negative transcriptional regulator [Acetobacteraceae bacterium]|nr:FMN-binding negative transcriptional regulator [Acetobacteraceae bacterium]
MYARPVFDESDPARIRALIEANPFGLLITHSETRGLDASPIPFVLEPEGEGFVLAGHLAAGNPQCAMLNEGAEALATFGGPHAYVSPGWYGVQPAVPTWDYAAVHVKGTLSPLHDPEAIAASMQRMAAWDPTGFDVQAMDPAYRSRMIAGVRAFRLRPVTIESQWKMSQNRSIGDRMRVIAALQAQGDPMAAEVAKLIAETLPA